MKGVGGLVAAALLLLAMRGAIAARWDDYQIIMYMEQTPHQWEALRALGVTAGKVYGSRAEVVDADKMARDIAPLVQAKMPWYVENIATDFYSAYHYWTPEHPNQVNWRFVELQRRHRRDRNDRSVFLRDPSLSDPAWLQRIRARIADNVRAFAPYRPLYYNLADESGIADLSAAWDFDFSPESLKGFRAWLRTQYASLEALNREWATHFTSWDTVLPPTTTEAMRRADQNFSAWADFKAWMDEAFARALHAGTDAVHTADPTAVAAIEGAQVPGWGGYDYTKLAGAVDLMEINDAGNNVDILRSLNPRMKLLTTSFGSGGQEMHRIWHELLLGGSGLIIWDENHNFVDATGRPGARAKDAAATYAELRGGIGAQIMAASPHADPVAILYSPASFRTFWMLSQRLKGDAWTNRGSGQEAEDNPLRAAIGQAASQLVHLGIAPRFVSPRQIEQGVLQKLRVLLLPHAIGLSDAGVSAIRAFVAHGGVVLADVEPGTFDQHSRRRPAPPLSDLRDHGIVALPDTFFSMRHVLAGAGVKPSFQLTHADGSPVTDVEARVFDDGDVTIIALQHDLPPAPEDIVLTLAAPRFIHPMRGQGWVSTDRLPIRLDGVAPKLLVIAATPWPAVSVSLPASVPAGAIAALHLTGDHAVAEAVHLDLVDPKGQVITAYSGNAVLRDGSAVWSVPFAAGDIGRWTVRMRAVLSGTEVSLPLEVR